MSGRAQFCGDRHVRVGPARHAPATTVSPAVPSAASRSEKLRFRRMTRFVIDAPTLLHLVAEDVPVAPGHQLVAPNLLRSQALALLFDDVREGRLTEPQAMDRHEQLTAVKVRLLGDRVSRRVAWQIARE